MESPIIPLGDKIVILPQEEGEQMYGNIIVPDAGQEKPEMGTVLAVGPGRISTDGTLIPNRIEVGVTVMVPKFGAQVVTVENATINESFEAVPFDSNLLKEILKANRTYHSGEIRINKKGLLDAHLHHGDNLYTGYYSNLSNAIQKISRLGLANQKEEYTLAGFIESFNNIKNKLTNSIKN